MNSPGAHHGIADAENVAASSSSEDNAAKIEKRVRALDEALLISGQYQEVLESLISLIERGASRTSMGTVIIGPSGIGKTTLMTEVERRFPRIEHPELTEIPVVVVSMPSSPSEKNLAESFLSALRDPCAYAGTGTQKTDRAIHFLQRCKTRLVMIDEAHTFVEHRSDQRVRQMADWFKLVIDRSRVPAALFGLPATEELLRHNEQLRRRFSARITLRPFTILSQESFSEFIKFLEWLETKIDLRKRPSLASRERAKAFFFATNGLVGYAKKIVVSAMRSVLLRGGDRVEDKDLAEAFRKEVWAEAPNDGNPFAKGFRDRILDGTGEPFEPAVTVK